MATVTVYAPDSGIGIWALGTFPISIAATSSCTEAIRQLWRRIPPDAELVEASMIAVAEVSSTVIVRRGSGLLALLLVVACRAKIGAECSLSSEGAPGIPRADARLRQYAAADIF